MKAAVMTGIKKVEIQERPMPEPKDDEVLVCTIMGPEGLEILLLSRLLYLDMRQEER